MNEILATAWKQSAHLEGKKRLDNFKEVFMTHREMGMAEAFYRMLPDLHMKESSVGCIFVSTDFPEKRHKFLYKVPSSENQGDSFEMPNPIGEMTSYREKPSIHDYYSKRPPELENLCLAQFAVSYDQSRRKKPISTKEDAENKGTDIEDVIENEPRAEEFEEVDEPKKASLTAYWNENKPLPQHIQINMSEPGTVGFSLRKFEKILRLHKHKKEEDYFAFIYGELILFWPWRNEEKDLFAGDFNGCLEFFQSDPVQETIIMNRKKLFPLEEYMESLNYESKERPSHIGDELCAQNVQNDEDDFIEGMKEYDDFYLWDEELECKDAAVDHSDPKNDNAGLSFETTVPSMRIMTKAELCESILTHSFDQHHIYKKFVNYAKDVVKSKLSKTQPPTPPLILMHGSGGKLNKVNA